MNDIGVNTFAVALLYAWVPIILALFAMLRPRHAVIAAFVIGYLFLPEAKYTFHTLPDVSKVSLTAVGVVLGSLLFDGGRLFSVRPKWIDLAWLALCLSPIITSLLNDLGIMDGLSSSLNRICTWGLAYWIGRAYFADWAAVRDLAVGLVIGGLVYAPLCWWEIRMSPQLHGQVYGLEFASFRKDVNIFGYRPNVFLVNGLTVTMFMGISALCAYWLWMSGAVKHVWGLPIGGVFVGLLVTTIFCKALGGVVVTLAGMGALTLARWPQTKMAALALVFAAPVYICVRASGDWSGQKMVQVAQFWSKERADSLAFRLKMENLLADKALRRPGFGWGGWSRSHVWDNDTGRDLTLVDGLWIIMLGEFGVFGLASLMVLVLGSALMLLRRIPVASWLDPACGGAVALAMVIVLYMIDGLFNATFNPVASLAVGAVASIGVVAASTFPRKPAVVSPIRAGLPALVSSVKDLPYVYSSHRS